MSWFRTRSSNRQGRQIFRKLLTESLECRRVFAGIPITTLPYTQNFDSLASTGTANTALPAGWEFSENPASATPSYRADVGTSTAGDTYSFGASGSTERAFGTLQSGTLVATIGASFLNDTTLPFTSLSVNYTGEQWRVGTASRPDRLDFQYSLDATSLTTGAWVDVDSLDFNAIQSASTGAKDGNATAFRTLISGSIPATVPAGATIYIRWVDFNATGADDGMAIDDFTITANSQASLAISTDLGSVSQSESSFGQAAYQFTVNRTGPATDQLTVDWAVGGSGPYGTDAADFQGATSGTLTFAAGVTSLPITISVVGDMIIEPDEAFAITLTNARNVSNASTGVSIGNPVASSAIVNDDLQNLVPGDVVVTGINTTNPDQFSFVPLVDLVGNLPIKFTDNGWDGSLAVPALVDVEGTVMYVTPAAGLAKGTKVTIEVLGSSTVMRAGPGSSTVTGTFGLSSTGENLFAYQGSVTAPQFLFGVNTNISYLATGNGAISNTTTYLPLTLAVGDSATAPLGETSAATVVNGEFNHNVVVGTTTQLKAGIANATNWNRSSSAITLNSSNFTVGAFTQVAIQSGVAGANEGSGSNATFTFSVTRTGDGLTAQSVDYTVTGTGSNPAVASDFLGGVLPSGTVTFAADGTLTKNITVTVVGDSTVELDESFIVTLTNPSSGVAVGNATTLGTILNDDLQALAPGDVVITGINATNPDQFSFVPLVDLVGNTQLFFTDNGFDGTSLATSEGTVTYIVPPGGISAGTKVVVTVAGTPTVDVGPGTATLSGGFALNAAGENLFAYLGSSTNPTFLFGVNTNISYLTTGAISASTTYLPSSLAIGTSATAPLGTSSAVANAQYDHVKGTVGSVGMLQSLAGDSANWASSTTPIALSTANFSILNTQFVTSITSIASTLAVRFAKALDVTKLNLVDSNNVHGASDVTLIGATVGAVKGSVVLDADGKGLTFVKSGGPFAADTYTLTLRSAANGFIDSAGNLLDGNADGTAGDDYVRTFSVTAIPDSTVVLSVPDFVRGAGQAVNLPANTTNGLPITISTGVNVTGASFNLNYNPALLTITGGTTSIAGATVTVDTATAGVAKVTVTSATQFSASAGALALVNLITTVPTTAPLGSKAVLRLSNVSLTAADASALASATDDGLLVSGYKGDVNNSNSITTGDVTGLLRSISGGLSTTGFPSYKLADPTILGDMNDSSSLSTGDATGLLRFISGAVGGFPAIPALPSGLTPTFGADPQIFIPQNLTVTPGNSVVVPINVRVTEPAGVSVAGVDVTFTYDSNRFTIGTISTGAALAGFSFSSSSNTGTVGTARLVFAADVGPSFANGFVGTLLNVTLNAKADAAAGPSPLNLTAAGASDNNTDDLTIAPAITPGADSSDGVITVLSGTNGAPTALALSPSSVAENAGANATIGTFTTTDPDAGDTFTYTLVTGTGSADNASFNISGNTLRATASLDFETKSSYTVRVRTTDAGGLFFESAFTITVTNVNEAPVFNPTTYTFSLPENSATGTAVGTVIATDVDAGTTLTYTLTGTGASNFAISATGAITVAAGAVLDFEGTKTWSLSATASDGSLSATAPVTINLTNVNETPVFNPTSYTFALPENSATGTAVGTVIVTDVDAGTTLTYTLTGTGASNFAISSTGAITVAAGAVLDFEGTRSWSLTATASDGSLSATAPVTINLTNVNEAPVFNPTSYTFSLPENSATGTAVGTVIATDVDAGTTLTYTLTGTGASNFAISSSGAITVAAGAVLDFEGTNSWSLTATASDGSLSATAPVTINLTNVNEAPVFNPTSYTFALPENSATGTAVGTVIATDVDAGTTLTYTLAGTGASNFAISSSGAITVAAGAVLDFEGTGSWSLIATASDGSLSATAPVTINLTNVNETPVFNPASYTFALPENSATGTAVGTVLATDVDAGTTLTYTLAGTGASNFAISSSGAITVAAGAVLDFEGTRSWSLIATASDGSLSATAPVTINLTNVNETPVFNPASYTFALPENSATGTAVGTVTATDVDAGTTLTYTLTGTGASNFAISASTGAITVAAGAVLDFEGTKTWSLTATVSDGSLSATAPVTIDLTNVNETPVFNPTTYTFSLPENSATGTAVGTVTATDVDAGTTLVYTLTGTGASNFAINASNGAIIVAAGAVLDFEGTKTWSLIATVSDGSLSATAPVTINLTNVNETPVFNPTTYTFSLPENSATGAAVGTVIATDVDAGTTLVYTLTGTGASNFAINASTGAISVAAGAVLDFEGTKTWSLTATASDGSLSATAPVTINLTNVNETPVFNPTTYTFSLPENSATGTAVGAVVATDVDAGTTLTFTLTGPGASNFAISSTGAITVAAGAVLDFEGTKTWSLTATASDGSLSATAPVTINLTNVNETPVFNPTTYTFSLPENSATATAVGTVIATDVDAGTTLTYTLTGTGSANFAINASTGAITVAAGAVLDFEGTKTWSLTATASDGSLSATAPVTINLTNVNEAPVFNPASYTFSLAASSTAGTAVGTVIATDVDAGTTLTYTLTGTGASNFAINASTGAITVATGASFGSTTTWNLTATASDGSLSATAPVTINLTNVNEPPVFNPTSYTFSLAENSPTGTVVGSVIATDVNSGTTLTYGLTGTGVSNFAINASTGVITVAAGAVLDFEGTKTWSLTATVSDGSLAATAPVTINLTNVNETPVFNPTSYTFSLPENSATAAAVGTVIATDVDAGTTLTYTLTGTGASNFTINASTGAITVAAGAVLNFEGTKTWSLTASVSDGSLVATAPVTINLTDVNESPVFSPANYTFAVAENTPAGTPVGTVTAADPDAGTTLTYSLTGVDAANFTINPATGEIRIATGVVLNFEVTSQYSLSASVSDGTLIASAAVTINVTNVNEVPLFAPPTYTFNLAENSAGGTAVGTVNATDPEGATLTYNLIGSGSTLFVMNSSTGVITVAAGAGLDFEGTRTWNLTATASDGSLLGTAPVTINLTNVNEAPVFNPASYTFSLPENSATGTAVGTVIATDVDAGTTLTYTLTGTGASNFAINASTGAITVAAGAVLNFEGTRTWSLTATASDGSLAATAPVTINLTNVNEAPVFSPTSYTFSLPESSPAATPVGTVSATDPDAGTTLTYSLSGTGASNFAINPATGAITVAAGASFNAATTPSYNLTATVSDGSLTSTASVTVNISSVAPAPKLTSVVINGGDTFLTPAQRSEITSLVVTFSKPVTLSAGAFSIVDNGLLVAQSPVALAQSQILVTANAANTVFTIRFGSGPGVITRPGAAGTGRGNSLADGNFVLSIDPTKVTDGTSNLSPTNSVGDGDNEFGDDATDAFFRMFGDGNGDGVVSTTDTGAFRAALSSHDAAFDFDGDGSVFNSGVDRSNFLGNFGKRRR